MEELTRQVLQDISDLKRRGVLPMRCTLCGCGETEHHAETCPSHVPYRSTMAQPAVLRVLTMDEPVPLPAPCAGTYACDCPACVEQRERAVKRGRIRQPWEVRRAA